jgi:antagonist of KipI
MASRPLFKVKKPGVYTTFQDLGRRGYQKFGVVTSGAMDAFSLQIANMLVGNRRNEAGLEITMVGPELITLSDTVVAICGADLSPKINDEPVSIWKSLRLKEGDHLSFGTPRSGVRTYIAASGGFDVPVVMGSKSTYAKAGIGKVLEKGDTIYGEEGDGQPGVGLAYSEVPQYEKEVELRVVSGPHTDRFTKEGLDTFFNVVHTVTPQSDRMGYRLESPPILHRNGADIWTDAIPFGGVQVPASGQPIILMADRQTTGGYTRIGTVISVDLANVAQLPPGGKIRFREIDVKGAREFFIQQEQLLSQIEIRSRYS